MYLAVPLLSCGTWGLCSSLQHVESLVAACKLLVEACELELQHVESHSLAERE